MFGTEKLGACSWLGGAFGKVGDVGDAEVHRRSSDKPAAAPADDDLGAAAPVGASGGARQSVGVADQQCRQPRAAAGGPLRVVAAALSWRDPAGLFDGDLEGRHRQHRIGSARGRVAAVKRVARTGEIVGGPFAKEKARRIRQRSRQLRERQARLGKQFYLQGVVGIVRNLGGDEMAHQQFGALRAVLFDRLIEGGQRVEAEPAHARVEMQGKTRAGRGAMAPALQLLNRADRGHEMTRAIVSDGMRVRLQAVEDENLRFGHGQRVAQFDAFRGMGDEKGAAARVIERRSDLGGAEPVAVGLDDARAPARGRPRGKPAPILRERLQIDGQQSRAAQNASSPHPVGRPSIEILFLRARYRAVSSSPLAPPMIGQRRPRALKRHQGHAKAAGGLHALDRQDDDLPRTRQIVEMAVHLAPKRAAGPSDARPPVEAKNKRIAGERAEHHGRTPASLGMRRRLVSRAGEVEIGAGQRREHPESVEAFGRQVHPPLRRRAGDEKHRLGVDESDELVVKRVVKSRHLAFARLPRHLRSAAATLSHPLNNNALRRLPKDWGCVGGTAIAAASALVNKARGRAAFVMAKNARCARLIRPGNRRRIGVARQTGRS